MKIWEYLVLEVKFSGLTEIEKKLDTYGAEGWELVAVSAFTMTQYLYLKRPAAA